MTNSTAQTRLHRPETLLNTIEGKQQQRKHITDTLIASGYLRKFLQEIEKKQAMKQVKALSPEEPVKQFFDFVEPLTNYSHAILPYMKGLITEPLKRLLKPHDIRVTTKQLHTLEQSFPSIKDRPSPENQTNVVCKIDCADCSWTYIGETGRTFNTRRKEHKRNVEHNKIGSNIANHAQTNNHNIDFKNGKIIDKGATTSTEGHSNHGTLHAQKTPTIIQNIYRNNTAFYL